MTVDKKKKYFCKCVYKWVEYFGLFNYEISIFEDKYEKESRGSCNWHGIDDGAQMISIWYSSRWLKGTKLKDIDRTAFHEVCEGMLSRISQLCHERFIQKRDVQTAIHEVIRRLENAILGVENVES